MSRKTIRIIGIVLTVVLGLLFAFSASLKLMQAGAAVEQATSLGISASTYRVIGIIELASLALFLYPRTAFWGSLLLIAYMGGAIATHLQHQQPVVVAVAVQVLLWITVAIRFPHLVRELFSKTQTSFQQF